MLICHKNPTNNQKQWDMNKINNLIKNKKVTIVLVCNFLGFHHGLVKEDLIIGQRFYTFGSNAKDILDKMYLVNI